MDRVMLDSHIYDAVAANPALKQKIERCQANGHITLLSTHIQAEELARIPPERDIGQASAVDTESIGTSVFVLDYSYLDVDRLGTPEADNAFSQLQINNPKHTEDAMIGATALTDADILVTNDIGFRKRFKKLGSKLRIMSGSEFENYLAGLLN
jgi:hypothetical protein